MNENTIKKLINEFNESDWLNDYTANIHTYKNDFNLQVRLGAKSSRQNDEELVGDQWDDYFNKYNGSLIVSVDFFYKDANLSEYNQTVIDCGVFIPLPVGANMIDEFYINEFQLARMLNANKNKYDNILNSAIKRKKAY